MPIGIYTHTSNQGFQKGHGAFKKKKEKVNRPSGLHYKPWSEETKFRFKEKIKQKEIILKGEYIECPVCKKVAYKQPCHIKNAKRGVYCSHKCYSISLKGKPSWNKGIRGYLSADKHYNWKGGITTKNKKIRASVDWKIWRKKVYERDEYICRVCGNKNTVLNPHHLLQISKFPQFAYELWNGLTVCVPCHKWQHRRRIKPSRTRI